MSSSVHDVVPFDGHFPSWEAFDVARKAHCEKTHTMYVCRNTVKVAVANKRRKLQVPDNWIYDRKVYVCTHGYKRVSRSGGSRPRQHVRFTNCKAKFTACVVSELAADGHETLFVRITGQHVIHSDHPVGLEQWRMYSQNRAAVSEHPYLTHEAELMRRVGSNKRATRAHLENLSGKVCTMKDMHNLYARLKKREGAGQTVDIARGQPHQTNGGTTLPDSHSHMEQLDNGAKPTRVESVLQRFVDADVENHVSILSGDDGSNESICLASRAMKVHFEVFPELLLLDMLIPPQMDMHPGQYLHGFLSMDALGNAKPVFLAQSSATSPSLLQRICQDFKRTHPKWVSVKIIAMDKLQPDVVQVLIREFPQVKVLLCQFHVLKLFNELLAQAQRRSRIQMQQPQARVDDDETTDQEKICQLLQQLVFAHSELWYRQTKALLAQQLTADSSRELITELDGKWEANRSLWVSYARAEELDFSSFFTKGLESFWNPVRNAFRRTSNDILAVTTATSQSATTLSSAVSHLPAIGLSFGSSVAGGQSKTVPANDPIPVSLAMTFGDIHAPRGSGRDPLTKGVSEILSMIKFAEEEWTSKMLVLELTKPVASNLCDPLLHLMVNCLSSFAVGLINSQLTAQSTLAVTVTKTRVSKVYIMSSSSSSSRPQGVETPTASVCSATEATNVRWLNKTTREKHILQRDGSSCDCDFFTLYQLPCRHLIWYEVSVLQRKQLSVAAVGLRWFLRTFQTPKLVSQRESNEIEYHLL